MTKQTHNIKDLGFREYLRQYRSDNDLESLNIGRIILEHKERYAVLCEQGEIDCELIGNLRFTAQQRSDLPAVGDWVAVNEYDTGKGLIHAVYPRENILERQAVGRNGEKQIIATNIDYGLIVQSVNRDYSINRLERYITLCNTAKIEPIIVLNKIDLIEQKQLNNILSEVNNRVKGIIVVAISNLTGEGLEQIKSVIKAGKTYCLLGSSGVGKSTLINTLAGNQRMKTGAINESIDRGKHITSHRELIVLQTGGIIIDNPGMREVGLTDDQSGLEITFEKIYELTKDCKFKDCSHQNESGCAILAALDTGELNKDTYTNFMKLRREEAHFSATVHEKRKKEKAFGKMVKQFVNQKHKNRT
ncbi:MULTISPECIES: ribosome small subunit-dependent GTPase A [unclassified Carboxylicivirga]|uniref:ribosome small subunit-dependent GTPase A n=1 Tax=Carboxylicivirga TaxID=1628153 RepID=UPI003D325A71